MTKQNLSTMTLNEIRKLLDIHKDDIKAEGEFADQETDKNIYRHLYKWTIMPIDQITKLYKDSKDEQEFIKRTGAISQAGGIIISQRTDGKTAQPLLKNIIDLRIEEMRRIEYAKNN